MKLVVGEYDLSKMYDQIVWSGADGQAARKVEFGVVVSGTDKNLPKPKIMINDPIQVYDDKENLIFDGEVIDKSKSIEGNIMKVVCLDRLYKVNIAEKSYSFYKKTPAQIAKQVFGDLEIQVGKLEDGSPIDRVFDMEKAYNIILIAYRLEYEKTKKPFIIRMNGSNAEVVERGKKVAKWQLDPKTNLIDSRYGESLMEAVNSVKMYDKDGKSIGEVKGDLSIPKSSTLTGGNNPEKVWNFFKGQGFSDPASAGIIGNLMQESSTSINPSMRQKGGPGMGIAQWTRGSDRWNNLNRFAKKKGTKWDNLQTQLEFMVEEMSNGAAYWHKGNVSTKNLDAFKKSTSVEQAVYDFERAYERAGKPNYKNRKKYANQVMQAFGGTGPAGGEKIYRQEKKEDPKARAEALLKGIEKKASVRAFGDLDLVTGNAVMIKEPFTGLNGKFFIVGDTHTFADNKHVVELELSYQNLMEEIDTSIQEKKKESSTEGVSSIPVGDGSGREKALQVGKNLVGLKYQWGGNTPKSGLDCSGFVDWCYTQAGMKIPGRLQSHALRRNPGQFNLVEIPWKDRKPGDVIWQNGHVGMQYYDGKIIESGGVSKHYLGYSGVYISKGSGRRFNKAYRYKGT